MSWNNATARQRIIKGAVTTVGGTFIIALATFLVLLSTGKLENLLIVAASATATAAIGAGMKPQLLGGRHIIREMPIVELMGAGGIILAGEVIIVAVAYPSAAAILYALTTIFGCAITLWGNYTSITLLWPSKTPSQIAQNQISDKLLTP